MKPVTKLVVALLPLLLIVGCGDKATKVDDTSTSGENVVVDGGASTANGTDGTLLADEGQNTTGGSDAATAETSDTSNIQDATDSSAADSSIDQDLLAERKIYFEFDRSQISDDYKEILNAHANFLMSNAGSSIVIEGHCDERGTREYNMALGERRAFSVLQYLALQGVSKSQMDTVSFGEERSDVEGHDESAWKYNRRAVFVYSE